MSCGCTPSSTNDRMLAFRARGPDQAKARRSRTAPPCRTPAAPARARAIRVRSDRLDVVDRHAEPDGAGDVRRAGLELVRQRVPRRLLEGDGADHVAAALERRHRLEQRFLAVEHADAGRAVQLVAGGDVEIAVERLDVDRHVVRRLRTVEQHRHAAAMRDADDLRDRIDRAERVRHVRRRTRASSARRRAPRTRRASARRGR